MNSFRFLLLIGIAFPLQQCAEKKPVDPTPLHAELLPANAQPVQGLNFYSINCWTEKEQFFVTGLCVNQSADWQKIWLDATPIDASGKPLAVSGHASAIVSTYSSAVPPQGRTSFFASWPLKDFSGKPDTCLIKIAGAIQPAPGPILAVPLTNGLRMMAPAAPGQPATEETAWYMTGTVLNALPVVAARPMLEVLVWGKDNRLWLATLLDPGDPAVQNFFHFDRSGPMDPGEERAFTLQVFYQTLPKALQEIKIGRVEILPFELR